MDGADQRLPMGSLPQRLIMTAYYRPNLTPEQRDELEALVKAAIDGSSGVDDPRFDLLYRVLLKLRDCKRITTDKKPKA